jgi:transcriptional regulator with XRE-family HTH domain
MERLRARLRVPRQDLARWLGISPETARLLERGRQAPSPRVLSLMVKLEAEAADKRPLAMHTPEPIRETPAGTPLPPAASAALDQLTMPGQPRQDPPGAPEISEQPAAGEFAPPRKPVARRQRSAPDPAAELPERLRALRSHLGVTRPKLAAMLGVCRQYIGKVERGQSASKPFVKLVEKLEDDMRRSLQPPPAPASEGRAEAAAAPAAPAAESGLLMMERPAFPRIAAIPLLNSREALQLREPGQASRHAREFFPFGVADSGALALRLQGDAMQPLHCEGEIVILYPEAGARIGDRVVVRVHDDIGGQILLRILSTVTAEGRWTLTSPNPAYAPIVLEKTEILWSCVVAATVRLLRE